jgi:histidinol-phosphatase (PHP family)
MARPPDRGIGREAGRPDLEGLRDARPDLDQLRSAQGETVREWRVSMHGGHSSEGSSHGSSTLAELLDAAVARGMRTYGVSNHAPPSETRFLYDDEIEAGIDLAGRRAQFEAYAALSAEAVATYAGRLEVLRGFEAEVVPAASYVEEMRGLRERYGFEYVVGSVHHVDELPIDVSQGLFDEAVERLGGLEGLLVRYYEQVAEMVEGLRPEVLGHFDLPRLLSEGDPAHEAPAVVAAADAALEVVAVAGSLLEVNTAGYRKGLRGPYPAPRVVRRASELGVGLTFSDDSHEVAHVGANLERARAYLLGCGVRTIGALGRASEGSIERREIPL